MQRQSSFEEESSFSASSGYDMRPEEVRIEGVAQAGMKFMRRWVLAMICVVYTVMILAITLIRGHISPVFLGIVTFAVGLVALMLWAQTTLMAKYWPQKHRPNLTLTPDKFQVESPIAGFQAPWSEIGEIRGVSFFGFPLVLLTDPDGKLKQRLGSKYWMYWWPGGIGLNAMTFGHTGKGLAKILNDYRESVT
jgi:hypothetical protein